MGGVEEDVSKEALGTRESTKDKGRIIDHGRFTSTKQPRARIGEQGVSNTFGVDVERLSEGKVDYLLSRESIEFYQDPLS